MPMAAMLTRNRLLGWLSVTFSVLGWLGESEEGRRNGSTPGYFSVAMSCTSSWHFRRRRFSLVHALTSQSWPSSSPTCPCLCRPPMPARPRRRPRPFPSHRQHRLDLAASSYIPRRGRAGDARRWRQNGRTARRASGPLYLYTTRSALVHSHPIGPMRARCLFASPAWSAGPFFLFSSVYTTK